VPLVTGLVHLYDFATVMSDAQTGTHVAVIEDDDLERGALGRLLHAGGFEPELFESAEGFIAARQTRTWQCLVVDVHLGGMSGIELQQRLHAEGSGVPVIITTGNQTDAVRERAKQAGCAAFLRKPFSAEAILTLVVSLSDQPRT
jgi:FixJ family two-component response regulator